MKGIVGIFDSQILHRYQLEISVACRYIQRTELVLSLYFMKEVYWAIYCSLAKTVTVNDVCCDDQCGI